MRELNAAELAFVSGGEESGGNTYGGVNDPDSFGQDLVDLYEGLVYFTSHVIERVANAL